MTNYLTKIRAFSFIFLLLSVKVYGQPKFVHYNVDDGLSQSSVYSIFQDTKGFMWFGTGDGLNRFDGYQFEVYKTKTPSKTGLSNSFITGKAIEDKNGNLWFGTRSGGINKYISKEHRFEQAIIYNGSDSNFFDCDLIDFDSKGNLWFVKGSNILGCYNEINRQSYFVEMPEDISYHQKGGPNRMGIILHDTLYFVGNRQLACFIPATRTFHELPGVEVKQAGTQYALYHDPQTNTIWVGTEKGVLQYHQPTNQYKWIDLSSKHEALVVYSLVKDAYNRLWIGTALSGLLCYDLNTQTLTTYRNDPNKPNGISFDIVRTLFIDRSQNLWIGTDGGGLNKLDLKPTRFKRYADHVFTKCFYEDEQKVIWYGTHENGIYKLNRSTGTQTQLKRKALFGNVIAFIAPDVYGHLMIGSNNGLDYYENGKYTEVPTWPEADKISSFNIMGSVLHTREKTTLLATRLGLYEGRYLNGRLDTLRLYYKIHTHLLGMHQSSDGRIWVGSEGNSYLFILKYENNQLVYKDAILQQSNVRSFYEDPKEKVLWMASSRGLIKYDLVKNTTQAITVENGLPDNYLYAVLPDEKGRLWISSNKGLTCYNPKDHSVRNYTVSDGLQSNEFNTGSFYKSPSGELFFGGVNGFNSFYPAQLKDNPYAPRVSLTSLKVNDGMVPCSLACGGFLKLPYDSSTVSFEFTALEFTNPAKNRYRYKLEGWDNKWVEAGSKRFARYSNLPAGNYAFKVQACNNDKVWGAEETLLKITISPPYWKQWWFIVLMIAAGMTLVVFYTRQFATRRLKERLRELEKQQAVQKERERISKDMHDELGSGLSRIAIQSELLKRKLKQNENAEQQAEKIMIASRELVDNLSEIVWAMNPKHDSMQSLMAYLREFTTDLFEDSSTRCRFNFPEPVPDLSIPSEIRRNIYLILKEALNNAFKYARATEVALEMKVNGNNVTFTVSDNGIGFDMHNTRLFGNGVSNMNRRAKAIQARLIISSEPGRGARIDLTVKI